MTATAYTLRSISVESWDDVHEKVPALSTWAWCDITGDGVHTAKTLPISAPRDATHLWGWTAGQQWCRLRLDGEHGPVHGAVLCAGQQDGMPHNGMPVAVLEQAVHLWSPADGRTGRRERAWPPGLEGSVSIKHVVAGIAGTLSCLDFLECFESAGASS